MKKKIMFIIYLVFLLPGLALAEIQLRGEVKTFFSLYERGKGEAELRILPELEWQISEQVSFFAQGDIRWDEYSQGFIDSFSEREDRWAVNLREAYAKYDGIITATIGKQIFDWSVTDVVSPSNFLNPIDWTKIPDFEEIGIPAVSLVIGDERKLFGQAVYIPFFTPSKLPQGEWERDLPIGVSLGDQEYDKNKDQFTLRVGGTTERGEDWTLGYYDGISTFPQARVRFLSPTSIEVVPVYSDLKVLTGSLAKELFGSIFKTDIGYFDQKIGDDFFQYVIGVDRHLFSPFRSTDDLYLLLQYAGEEVIKRDRSAPDQWFDSRRIFPDTIMLQTIYNLSDLGVWSLEGKMAHNLSKKDGYAEASAYFNPPQLSGIEVEVGVGVPYGPKGTFWGEYGTRFFTGVSKKF
jgi:hypothetical protein